MHAECDVSTFGGCRDTENFAKFKSRSSEAYSFNRLIVILKFRNCKIQPRSLLFVPCDVVFAPMDITLRRQCAYQI